MLSVGVAHRWVAVAATVLTLVAACSSPTASTPGTLLSSQDGRTSVVLPSGWEALPPDRIADFVAVAERSVGSSQLGWKAGGAVSVAASQGSDRDPRMVLLLLRLRGQQLSPLVETDEIVLSNRTHVSGLLPRRTDLLELGGRAVGRVILDGGLPRGTGEPRLLSHVIYVIAAAPDGLVAWFILAEPPGDDVITVLDRAVGSIAIEP
jgi:hypothetical protein